MEFLLIEVILSRCLKEYKVVTFAVEIENRERMSIQEKAKEFFVGNSLLSVSTQKLAID